MLFNTFYSQSQFVPISIRKALPCILETSLTATTSCVFCASLLLHLQGLNVHFVHFCYPTHRASFCILHISPTSPTTLYRVFCTFLLSHPHGSTVCFEHPSYPTHKILLRILHISLTSPTLALSVNSCAHLRIMREVCLQNAMTSFESYKSPVCTKPRPF